MGWATKRKRPSEPLQQMLLQRRWMHWKRKWMQHCREEYGRCEMYGLREQCAVWWQARWHPDCEVR